MGEVKGVEVQEGFFVNVKLWIYTHSKFAPENRPS